LIARRLVKVGVPHNVLNAKYHEREAEIVAQAGRKGAITIATNMAGRGTDILLGGNPDFMAREFLKETRSIRMRPPKNNGRKRCQAKRIVESEHQEVVARAACTSSARNATNRAASTISFVGALAARVIRVRRVSSFPSKTI